MKVVLFNRKVTAIFHHSVLCWYDIFRASFKNKILRHLHYRLLLKKHAKEVCADTSFEDLPAISLDVAIMEKTAKYNNYLTRFVYPILVPEFLDLPLE